MAKPPERTGVEEPVPVGRAAAEVAQTSSRMIHIGEGMGWDEGGRESNEGSVFRPIQITFPRASRESDFAGLVFDLIVTV